ncbi:MAG TPA: potassium-transporting ATPase subunit KdpA [Sporichthyaceae bacterium]|jgi:K+-transporting ATPase ATPase A chain|nr:potassium-transporting ATPase subunit KdpA [Sporichthyaceae bacterium]
MGTGGAGILFDVTLIGALALIHVPFGDYMYRVFTSKRHWRSERLIYRGIGVDADAEQSWGSYARSLLAFSAMSVLLLYVILRLQQHLPGGMGRPGMTPALAWNTAGSFTTNTNWQAYSGEAALGHGAQMFGLAVQNFLSAAVGIAVAIALVRGFARQRTTGLGNFWVDVVRCCTRILLPFSVIAATLLIAGGSIQNFQQDRTVTTLAGAKQVIIGGPIASQEAIKQFGTNGGGFANANSAHPFESGTPWTNWLQLFLLLAIAFSLPRTFGRMVGDRRQGYAIVSVMATLAVASLIAITVFQAAHHGTVPSAIGSSYEGIETRFGVPDSAAFGDGATLTSTGSVDSVHDSYTALGGGVFLVNMMFGEVAPGGVGSGLYGLLILAVVTVFVAGLMVGRTPEYLGKKIGAREMKFAATYYLITPMVVLVGTAVAIARPGERAGMANTGPHGFSEVLYAFTSAGNNNGSAFGGLTANTVWYNTALGAVMLVGRFLPMIFVLALAGSLASQGKVPDSAGTLPTHRPQFIAMVVGVVVILIALTYLPALALGPLAEGI